MKIAVAGGHGQIALRLERLLAARGDEVTALIRNPEHSRDVAETGARPVVCDLESAEPEEVERAIEGADVVVFAAGAGPGSGAGRKETMDYGGAALLTHAAVRAGVPRYVMVSSMGADPEHPGDEVFDVYLRAKGQADAELAASGLDYTILRPGRLTDDPGTGRVAVGASTGRGEISRDDVAALLAAIIADPRTVGLTLEAIAGDELIEAALDLAVAAPGG